MATETDPDDPKGLIRESYRIEGIGMAECRTIFLDWAISVPDGMDSRDGVRALLDRYGTQFPDHPMTAILAEALEASVAPKRRGGAKGRRGSGS